MSVSILLTGASGFIGRTLLRTLADRDHSVIALRRNAQTHTGGGAHRTVTGDLQDPASLAAALDGIDTVLHLAAITGKAPTDAYFRINHQSTIDLLAASARAGVRRFLFVSTIAVRYGDAPGYHYAHSKQHAEEAVLRSGLRTTIVRPTIVLGPESPIGGRLRSLAALPVLVMPGHGRVRVQPIDVRDVASAMVAILEQDRFGGETIEAGGPDTLMMEELLLRLRERLGRSRGGAVHLPLGAVRAALLRLERLSLALTPVTAGQLAAFANDSIAAPHPLMTGLHPGMRTIDTMLGELAHG